MLDAVGEVEAATVFAFWSLEPGIGMAEVMVKVEGCQRVKGEGKKGCWKGV